ncbi:MAG TPA: hypothetical protein VMF58_01930 [Rhizomicrobium sp.]|nr:hypothetical protein [Rhizomicrobium sp.]
MLYCPRLNRPCSCSGLHSYSRDGRAIVPPSVLACLTGDELSNAIDALSLELRHRAEDKGQSLHIVA